MQAVKITFSKYKPLITGTGADWRNDRRLPSPEHDPHGKGSLRVVKITRGAHFFGITLTGQGRSFHWWLSRPPNAWATSSNLAEKIPAAVIFVWYLLPIT